MPWAVLAWGFLLSNLGEPDPDLDSDRTNFIRRVYQIYTNWVRGCQNRDPLLPRIFGARGGKFSAPSICPLAAPLRRPTVGWYPCPHLNLGLVVGLPGGGSGEFRLVLRPAPPLFAGQPH